jgi:hypothetical protein
MADFQLEIKTERHRGENYTGKLMHELCREFFLDLGPALDWPFFTYWDFVRQIPYMDNERLIGNPWHEILSRPEYVFSGIFPGIDCKMKACLIGAWCYGNGWPYKFIACAEDGTRDIHHVFPLIYIPGEGFVSADCTFPNMRFGESKPTLSYAKELTP